MEDKLLDYLKEERQGRLGYIGAGIGWSGLGALASPLICHRMFGNQLQVQIAVMTLGGIQILVGNIFLVIAYIGSVMRRRSRAMRELA